MHVYREQNISVSIHAPARGATPLLWRSQTNSLVSIHAPARGATCHSMRPADCLILFQSTRPRGARLQFWPEIITALAVSIHAPARGATPSPVAKSNQLAGFNPRAREGRDHQFHLLACNRQSFNPRAREGRDFLFSFLPLVSQVSIHAPARGATWPFCKER